MPARFGRSRIEVRCCRSLAETRHGRSAVPIYRARSQVSRGGSACLALFAARQARSQQPGSQDKLAGLAPTWVPHRRGARVHEPAPECPRVDQVDAGLRFGLATPRPFNEDHETIVPGPAKHPRRGTLDRPLRSASQGSRLAAARWNEEAVRGPAAGREICSYVVAVGRKHRLVGEQPFRKASEPTIAPRGERDHVCRSVKGRRSANDKQLSAVPAGRNAIARKPPPSAGHEIDRSRLRRDEPVRDKPKMPRRR